ncbi:hypothetical protein IV203_006877 [Nitzschia inconspicua]|uniref:Uncharacterized protein n=1 Tax=Nitzschia inconspicua TaxID=303405 RepID=A0A9K3PCB6_9STRA|nr:hypothetical protein IV203_006877 [Nitzschia inconspicua]
MFDISLGCEKRQCMYVPETDCGTGSLGKKLRWFKVKGILYQILVQSSIPVNFTVTATEYTPNIPNTCEQAVSLTSFDSRYVAFGSTGNESPEDSIAPCLPTNHGVLFKVNGTGRSMIASTCHQGTSQPTNITLLAGDCNEPVCVDDAETRTCDGIHSIASWQSIKGQEYLIHVSGGLIEGQERFVLIVEDETVGVRNNFCSGAIPLDLGQSKKGSTASPSATLDDYIDLCGDLQLLGPGVWYSFTAGNGTLVKASPCNINTNFDTEIRIYNGDCTALQCVNNDDDFCGSQSEVTWEAMEGVQYYILVSGFKEDSGDFELTLLSA